MTLLIKLGGSVITEKDQPETVDVTALDQAAQALERVDESLIVVHGGGSFGHHHAAAHGMNRTTGSYDAAAIRAVHEAMKRLNAAVVDRLAKRGTPAVPIHPFSAAERAADGTLTIAARPVETLLAEGFVPVLHGDVVAHHGHGATILSGDELVVTLARTIDPTRIGLCTGVPGVLDRDGEVIPTITNIEMVASQLEPSESTDVTGGMEGKVEALLSLDQSSSIFDLDGLDAFVDGGTPGTRIEGGVTRDE